MNRWSTRCCSLLALLGLTAAEAGDLAPTLRLLEVISSPFSETPANEAYRTGAPAGSPAYCTFCGT